MMWMWFVHNLRLLGLGKPMHCGWLASALDKVHAHHPLRLVWAGNEGGHTTG